MHAIKATWSNGFILPSEPVNWPDGIQLRVEPMSDSEQIGMNEADWKDDPASIAAWIAGIQDLKPMKWEEGEEEAYQRYREETKRFNIEAVRRQMESASNGEIE